MAIFHLTISVVTRGKDQSIIAKAAYNSRSALVDKLTGEVKDYTYKRGLVYSNILAPANVPEWAYDREQLWNAAELRENLSNRKTSAQLSRNVEISLPHELTKDQRECLVKEFVEEQFTSEGMVADVNIHAPEGEGDKRNHHVHILLTMRELLPAGFGMKVRKWNRCVVLWRKAWEDMANKHLKNAGHDVRIDRRDLQEQGIDRKPSKHRGPHIDAMTRKGKRVELLNIVRDIWAEKRQYTLRVGGEVRDVRRAIRDSWDDSGNYGLGFQGALSRKDLRLAIGHGRDFFVVDRAGRIYPLGKGLLGVTAAQAHKCMLDLDLNDLPSVEQARRDAFGESRTCAGVSA